MKLSPELFAFLQKLTFGGSIFMILFCGGLIVTYVAEIIAHENKHPISSQIGLMFFLAGIVFVFCRNVRARMNDNQAVKELKEEQSILNRARHSKVPLTITETALDCHLRIAETKKAFERLSRTGVCQIDVTEEGELCYRFPSFESDARKFILADQPEYIEQQERGLS